MTVQTRFSLHNVLAHAQNAHIGRTFEPRGSTPGKPRMESSTCKGNYVKEGMKCFLVGAVFRHQRFGALGMPLGMLLTDQFLGSSDAFRNAF